MVKKVLVFLVACVAVTLSQLDEDFEVNLETGSEFEADLGFVAWAMNTGFDLTSVPDETLQHYQENYYLNAEIINNVNTANLSFTAGFNQFSYLNSDEFGSTYLGLEIPPTARSLPTPPAPPAFKAYTKANLPLSITYKTKMQPVLNQGGCGSCWAFATYAMLEGYQKMKSSLWSNQLAPQYLVDCDTTNKKCNGGWPTRALNWIKNAGFKAPLHKLYPYTGNPFDACRNTTKNVTLTYKNVYQFNLNGDEEQLRVHLANYGPLVVAVQVSLQGGFYQNYKSGIFFDPTCAVSTETVNQCSKVNHAVVLVGYGTSLGKPYWLIKNSWGTGWGEAGYMRMARNRGNNCQTACYAFGVD